MSASLAVQVAGLVTSVLSVAAKGGVVSQMRANHREYRSGHVWHAPVPTIKVDYPREALYALSYLSWVVYGVLTHDLVVIANQSLGVLAIVALVVQVRYLTARVSHARRALLDRMRNDGGGVTVDHDGSRPMYHVDLAHPATDRLG